MEDIMYLPGLQAGLSYSVERGKKKKVSSSRLLNKTNKKVLLYPSFKY